MQAPVRDGVGCEVGQVEPELSEEVVAAAPEGARELAEVPEPGRVAEQFDGGFLQRSGYGEVAFKGSTASLLIFFGSRATATLNAFRSR